MYNISDYTFKKAKELGVEVKPSKKKNKKINVFKDGKLISSIGDNRFNDYTRQSLPKIFDLTTYLQSHGKDYADMKRKLYKLRHAKDLTSGNGYWAWQLLWN